MSNGISPRITRDAASGWAGGAEPAGDHPRTISRLAVLDIVPTGEAFRRADMAFSRLLGVGVPGRAGARPRAADRAGATLDHRHDEADRGTRRIGCPTLVLWSHSGAVAVWYEPLDVWRDWAVDVSGGPLAAGHLLAEEAPTRPPAG